MHTGTVVCYYCAKPSPGDLRHKACPYCGHRLPGIPSQLALGEHPQDSLRSLISWGWVFTGLGAFAAVVSTLLHGHAQGALWAAQATFAYSAVTCHLIGLVIALTLAAADIGVSRWHGLAMVLVLSGSLVTSRIYAAL